MLRCPNGVPGKRLALLTGLLVLATLAFYLANPLFQRQDEPRFSPGRDGMRPLMTAAPEAPEPEPEPEALLPLAPERIPTSAARGTGFAYADEEGVLLSNKRPSLESPDGRSELILQRDGNLVLRSRDADGAPNIIWSAGTGDGHVASARDVRASRALDGHPILEVVATAADGTRSTRWHSDLLPACASSGPSNSTARPRLELTSAGRLTLSGVCEIHAPASEREYARSLALIVSGTYSTNRSLCAESLLAGAPFASVDVFAHVSFEGPDDMRGKIEDELRGCYGEELRAAVVRPAGELREKYRFTNDTRLGVCKDEIDEVNARLRGLREAGKLWREWSAENGVPHDTVLAMRADGEAGAEVPQFRASGELRETLVVVRGQDDGYAYCPRMTGGVGIGKALPRRIPSFFSLFLTCA